MSATQLVTHRKRVAIVGGGLAGLSAGCALADAGFNVTLFERRPFLGGRASSYEHPGTGEVVDNCQHVLLGCCTNLIDFYERLGVEQKIAWFNTLHFVEPGGRRSDISPTALPAPLHTLPAFLRASFLDIGDKDAIARTMLRLMGRLPDDTEENFLQWLERRGQTERAIERFWKPVLVSALNEDLDRMSVHYAAQVFRESFLKSRAAGAMGVPRVPLTELYSAGGDYIRARGGEVLLRCGVDSVTNQADGISLSAAGERLQFDSAVLSVPFDQLGRMLPSASGELQTMLSKFEHSPITGIHLWFDRAVTDLPHAVLLDRTIQWMFNKTLLQQRDAGANKSYLELVVSSSKSLVAKQRQEVIDLAVAELAEFFPAAREAKLEKATVIKEVHATYSAKPLSDAYRPQARTEWPAIFLAGDWTATGWPATMEGAVRSGYKAAEALAHAAGVEGTALVPDLKPSGLMILFG